MQEVVNPGKTRTILSSPGTFAKCILKRAVEDPDRIGRVPDTSETVNIVVGREEVPFLETGGQIKHFQQCQGELGLALMGKQHLWKHL